MTIGHFQTIYESEDFLCVECFVKRNYAEIDGSDPDFAARIAAVHYENGKIIAQKTSTNPLDFDPSEYFEWKREDFEWLAASSWWPWPPQKSSWVQDKFIRDYGHH